MKRRWRERDWWAYTVLVLIVLGIVGVFAAGFWYDYRQRDKCEGMGGVIAPTGRPGGWVCAFPPSERR